MHGILQISESEVPAYIVESFVDPAVVVLVLPAIFGIDDWGGRRTEISNCQSG